MVRESVDVGYLFQGRRDRMVKRRGYRVELGEIEAGLYRHPDVSEVAVTAVDSEEHGVRIRAFVAWSGAGKPSTLAMKAFSAQQLLPYMIPDTFSFVSELPKTSTDKVDYQSLGASP